MPNDTIKRISRKAKQIRRKGESWHAAIKRASKIVTGKRGKVGKSKKRKTVRGVSTRSKSHTDKNKITANIQVGSIASHRAQIKKQLMEKWKNLLFWQQTATTKKEKRHFAKRLREIKKEYKKYC